MKAVISMAMSKPFDGENCASRSFGAKIENLRASAPSRTDGLPADAYGTYADFGAFELYREWAPRVSAVGGAGGMWFGSADCTPGYLHYGEDGSVSIWKD